MFSPPLTIYIPIIAAKREKKEKEPKKVFETIWSLDKNYVKKMGVQKVIFFFLYKKMRLNKILEYN